MPPLQTGFRWAFLGSRPLGFLRPFSGFIEHFLSLLSEITLSPPFLSVSGDSEVQTGEVTGSGGTMDPWQGRAWRLIHLAAEKPFGGSAALGALPGS